MSTFPIQWKETAACIPGAVKMESPWETPSQDPNTVNCSVRASFEMQKQGSHSERGAVMPAGLLMGASSRPLILCDIGGYYEGVFVNAYCGRYGGMGREDIHPSLFPNLGRFLIRIAFSYSHEQV